MVVDPLPVPKRGHRCNRANLGAKAVRALMGAGILLLTLTSLSARSNRGHCTGVGR